MYSLAPESAREWEVEGEGERGEAASRRRGCPALEPAPAPPMPQQLPWQAERGEEGPESCEVSELGGRRGPTPSPPPLASDLC